jgi:hypothetical protein
MSDEHREPSQKARFFESPPLRNKAAEIFSAVVLIAAAAFATYWYLPTKISFVSEGGPQITGSVPAAQFSADHARSLLDETLAHHPVSVRVPLGAVVTVDKDGQPTTIYSKLAGAQLIRVRYCHFPGASGPGQEVCVADLTEKGKQLAAASTASMIVPIGRATSPTNETYAEFNVGNAKVTTVSDVSPEGENEATVSYEATLETMPLASSLGVQEVMPSKVAGRARLRRGPSGWQIIENKLPSET